MVKTYFDSIFSRIDSSPSNNPQAKEVIRDTIITLAPVFEQNHQLIYQGILESFIEENGFMEIIQPRSLNTHTQTRKASGLSLVYFIKEMLADRHINMAGKTAIVTGSGTLARHAMRKLIELKVKILACSDEQGVIHDPYGIDLSVVEAIKQNQKASLEHYMLAHPDAIYIKNPSAIWHIPCHIALACDKQPPLTQKDAKKLVQAGCIALAEGTGMSTTLKTINYLTNHNVLYCPVNATAVGNTAAIIPAIVTDAQLESMMKEAYIICKTLANKYGYRNHLTVGANIAGFERLTSAMIA